MAHDAPDPKTKLAWKAVSTLAGVAGAITARKVLQSAWGAMASGDGPEPPLNPADRDITWSTAVAWAVSAGIGTGIARLVTQRMAAAGWESATGTAPPGIAT